MGNGKQRQNGSDGRERKSVRWIAELPSRSEKIFIATPPQASHLRRSIVGNERRSCTSTKPWELETSILFRLSPIQAACKPSMWNCWAWLSHAYLAGQRWHQHDATYNTLHKHLRNWPDKLTDSCSETWNGLETQELSNLPNPTKKKELLKCSWSLKGYLN